MIKHTLLASALLCAPMPLCAQSDAAKKFGARDEIQQISLSPDGKRFVAVVADAGRGYRAMVFTIVAETPPVTVLASNGDKEHLDYCQWSDNSRLIARRWESRNHRAQDEPQAWRRGYHPAASQPARRYRPNRMVARKSRPASGAKSLRKLA